MKNTQTHLFNLKLKRNFNLFSHSLFFFTFSSFKVGFSTGKIKENIIPEKYCNNNSWSAKFRNYKLRDSRTSAKHIGKWNIRESVGLTPKVNAAFLTIKFRALEEQIFQKHSPFYLLANLKKRCIELNDTRLVFQMASGTFHPFPQLLHLVLL